MELDWDTFNPPNQKMLNLQKTLEGTAAERRNRRRIQNIQQIEKIMGSRIVKSNQSQSNVTVIDISEETSTQANSSQLQETKVQPSTSSTNLTRLLKCFLVKSEAIKPYVNLFGWFKKGMQMRRDFFEYHITPPKAHKYTKITLITNNTNDMDGAEKVFNAFLVKKQVESQEIPTQHCSLCLSIGHTKPKCHNCSFCGQADHYRRFCPELHQNDIASQAINVVISAKRKREDQSTFNSRRRKREIIGNDVWFRRKNSIYSPEIEQMMRPIGGRGDEKITVSFDCEGSGNGEQNLGSVHVSGWFGGRLGANTVYYAEIKNNYTTNSNTPITGLQITDHQQGEEFQIVRNNLIKIFKNKRVITQGSSDWDRIRISATERETLNIEAINLQDLYSGGLTPMGLKSLDKFLFKYSPKLRRDDPFNVTAGHSPERDSRLTLQGYKKYLLMLRTVGFAPNGDEIRKMAEEGKTIGNWIWENIDKVVPQPMSPIEWPQND